MSAECTIRVKTFLRFFWKKYPNRRFALLQFQQLPLNLQLLSPDIILSLSCHLSEGKLVKRLNPIVWVNNGIRIILSWTPETGLLSLSLSLSVSLSLQKLLLIKIYSLLVAEVARCKNSLVTRCKFACYSLQKLLVAKNHSLLAAEVARCKNSLVVKNR